MLTLFFRLTPLLVAFNLLTGQAAANQTPLPAPVDALTERGIEIHSQFSAPGGLTGFGASAQGREMAIYLTPDGEHAIVGTLMDSEGNDLTAPQLDEHVRAPLEAQTWQLLEESHWIQDGDPQAPRVVYTFTDPNCPYCQQLWEAARPWIEAGEVQLRHIMVGILKAQSPAQAAALLGDDRPSEALTAHKLGEEIAVSAQPRDIEQQVLDNNQLFEELGLYATPTSAFQRRTQEDVVRIERIEGMPSQQRLEEMMGGAR
ncbi:thiol:disulfide interchange protein DsbG [Vreelandella aquamarina]|uniref:thiol:disulfide interchange protein DsbG n=1 Tax=Vreelandella aquamarina TaxID=77097 RepID=UPI00384E1736